ncbi:MAG TPA: multicopper oxidase domain-containing protein [Thermomicrobiales bacterium]
MAGTTPDDFGRRRESRRTVLEGAVSVVAGGALAAVFGGRRGGQAARASTAVELPQPKVRTSVNGQLALTLTAMPGIVEMGAPRPVKTYTYDNAVPGYTWEVDPGDTILVDLVNNLPEQVHPPPMRMDRPHEWTWTNLHTHGLHVSPAGIADNVFLAVPPGETQHYEIPLPADHPGGIFWYHPHRHGGVTQQVRAGMAGMIVVRGDIDRVDEVRAAKEQIMVLQAIELGDDFQLLEPIPNPTTEEAFFPRTQILYTVNGALAPKITMYPGEVQRWRMVNAAEGKYMSLRLKDHDLNVLAWDGLTLAAPDTVELVMLSAGNRVELLVKAGKPGSYDLVLTPGSSQKPDIPGMPDSASQATPSAMEMAMPDMQGMPNVQGELTPRPILTVEVVGSGPAMSLPASLPVWDPPILPIRRYRRFAFTVERTPANEFVSFGIDNMPFDPNRPPVQVKLGTAEEWELRNALDTKLMAHAHVFHIHVNPFKITKINGRTLTTPLWRDTFVLTKSSGDSLTFQSNFVDFAGKFVDHCHVLSHEDLGMMEAVEVIP